MKRISIVVPSNHEKRYLDRLLQGLWIDARARRRVRRLVAGAKENGTSLAHGDFYLRECEKYERMQFSRPPHAHSCKTCSASIPSWNPAYSGYCPRCYVATLPVTNFQIEAY